MRRSSRVVLLVSLGFCQLTGFQSAPTFKVYAVADLTKPRGAKPALRGAAVADPKDWKASFYSVRPSSCTSTLIGPRVLLTAAHCLRNGARLELYLSGRVYKGVCSQIPSYDAEHIDRDWALCSIEEDVVIPFYETVNSDPSKLVEGRHLLLTGYGCTKADGTGGADKKFRIGEIPVKNAPAPSSSFIRTSGSVALCFGDSGGGAYLFSDGEYQRRILIAVNSRIEKDVERGTLSQTSYLSSLADPVAQAFLHNWADENKLSICGVRSFNGINCKQLESEP